MSNVAEHGNTVSRPSLFWLFTESGRAITELSFSVPYRRFLTPKKRGDGHPVLVLPGFMSSDFSTGPLRQFIRDLGYTAYRWELGRNTAKVKFIDMILERVDALYYMHGEKISLIGWSLGGVYARQVAKARPHAIRQIITLGSPFKGVQQTNNVSWIYNLLSSKKQDQNTDPKVFKDIPLPAPVPTTAIYTKEDGIVPWRLCMEDEDETHQNIQVRGSHFGLGVNPSVLEVIADRLTYKTHNWRPFKPKNIIKSLLLYPSL